MLFAKTVAVPVVLTAYTAGYTLQAPPAVAEITPATLMKPTVVVAAINAGAATTLVAASCPHPNVGELDSIPKAWASTVGDPASTSIPNLIPLTLAQPAFNIHSKIHCSELPIAKPSPVMFWRPPLAVTLVVKSPASMITWSLTP